LHRYARRIARILWLPRQAVTFSSAVVTTGGGTSLDFSISASYLSTGSTAAGLQSYATSLPTTLYATILAVPVISVAGAVNGASPSFRACSPTAAHEILYCVRTTHDTEARVN
jgi:hypothetical protein